MKEDILIIGGGMVGAATALALARTHHPVTLIDQTSFTPKEDARLIALNANSVAFFQWLSLWETLLPYAEPIRDIHVSHQGHFGITRLSAEDVRLDALGYVIPARYINSVLEHKLSETPALKIIRPATLVQLRQSKNHVEIDIKAQDKLETYSGALLIGADGSHSTVRTLLDIPTETHDYQQSALVTVTELQRSHHGRAFERFQKEGAIAMLPLKGNRCATIWTDHHASIHSLLALSDADFLTTLQKAFGYRLGRFVKTETRAHYPLAMIRAKETVRERVILLGNAAHTLHPIAAQGLNLALAEVAQLAHYFEKNPGMISLQSLKNVTKIDQTPLHLSHHLTWVFSTDFFIVNLARQLGLIGLDVYKPAKQRFLQKALGRMNSLLNPCLEKGKL